MGDGREMKVTSPGQRRDKWEWLWECLGESFRSLDTGQWDDVIKGDASLGAGPASEYIITRRLGRPFLVRTVTFKIVSVLNVF